MKRIGLFIIMFGLFLVGISCKQEKTERNYTEYAEESLNDFYSIVIECLTDPDNQQFFLLNYKDNIAHDPKFVADIIDTYPTDEINSFESYLSTIKMNYSNLLRSTTTNVRIIPEDIVVKEVLKRKGGCEVQVSYDIKLIVDGSIFYKGYSEASIVYPKVNNRNDYKIKSVMPKGYVTYRKALLGEDDISKNIQLSKQSMEIGDYQSAKLYYESLVNLGEIIYLFDLANLYKNGYGVERDTVNANNLLQTLYEKASPSVLGEAASRFYRADDKENSYKFARKAADQGDVQGHYYLGLYFKYLPKPSESDLNKARAHFEVAAKGGIKRAYYCLACIAPDEKSYDRYLDLGIAAGDSECILMRGSDYERSAYKNVEYLKFAEYYYRLAAYHYNNGFAYLFLGSLYVDKLHDMGKAIECYQRGYSKGQHLSYKLFEIYSGLNNDTWEAQNITDSIRACRIKSLDYLKDAITESSDSGKYAYRGMCIYLNELTEPDYANAFTYAKIAADNGISEANYDLADMYYYGKGIEHNLNNAYHYYGEYLSRKDVCKNCTNSKTEILVRKRDSIGTFEWKFDPLVTERFGRSWFQVGYISQLENNYEYAVRYYENSLNYFRNAESYYQMGLIYMDSLNGNYYDQEFAKTLFRTAAKLGHKKSNDRLIELGEKPITP